MGKKKALFFLKSNVGGAERMTVSIAKALDTNVFEVVFQVIGVPKASRITDFIPSSYRVVYIKRKNPLDLARRFFMTLKKECPDFVFCSEQFLNRKLLFLSPLFPRCKFIVRNANYLYTHTRIQKILMRFSYPFADVVITQTEEMRDELIKGLGLKSRKVIVLHNPVDTRLIDEKLRFGSPLKTDKSKIRYIGVGRFAYAKGFDLLIEAFRIVSVAQPNAELYILGDTKGNGVYEKVQTLIEKYTLQGKVFLTGYTNNPYAYEKECDCFVLSSRNEGLPNVLIEALYIGLPVAAFKCIPVIERIVEEGKTGYLAEKGNPASLAEAMQKASKLGHIRSSYRSASFNDFVRLFG